MPKAVPTLYNHHECPTTSCILNIETTASGRQVMTSKASSVVVPQPTAVPSLPECYPMDDDDDIPDFSTLEMASDPGDMDDDYQSHDSGVTGIKVKPPKAKQYANSVCYSTKIFYQCVYD